MNDTDEITIDIADLPILMIRDSQHSEFPELDITQKYYIWNGLMNCLGIGNLLTRFIKSYNCKFILFSWGSFLYLILDFKSLIKSKVSRYDNLIKLI